MNTAALAVRSQSILDEAEQAQILDAREGLLRCRQCGELLIEID